jgi:hypothetical protein
MSRTVAVASGLCCGLLLGLSAVACSDDPGIAQQPLPAGRFGQQLDSVAAKASSAGEGMDCASRAFGVTPADARTLAEVTEIYAWSICGGVLIGTTPSGSDVPVAVQMSDPPVATEPPDDVGPGDAAFDALFPSDVLAWAGANPSVRWIRHGSR